jgi:hypothetical protein
VLNTAAVFPPPLKVAICRIGADLGRGYRMVNRRTAIPPNRSTPLYRVVRVVRTAGQEETLQRVRTVRTGTPQVPSLQPSKSESLALNPVASIPRVAGSTGTGSYGSYAVRVAWLRKTISPLSIKTLPTASRARPCVTPCHTVTPWSHPISRKNPGKTAVVTLSHPGMA